MDINQLLEEAMKIQKDISKTQTSLDEKEYETSIGGGAVVVQMKGNMTVKSISIKNELLSVENKEDLIDMLTSALNQTLQKIKNEKESSLKSLTSDMSIPGVF